MGKREGIKGWICLGDSGAAEDIQQGSESGGLDHRTGHEDALL